MPARIAAAVAAGSLLFAPAALAATDTPTTISVNGSGTVWVTPDLASLSLSVTRSAATPSAALSAMDRRADAIVAAVRAAGVPASGIQTESINESSGTVLTGPAKHRRRVRHYSATEALSINSTATRVGAVIDAATHNGADDISGPNFSFSDPDAGVVAATTAATTDATRRAKAAAAGLGYVVTGVQSVTINSNSGIVTPVSSSGSASTPTAGTPTTVHPGAQEVDASVTVVYTIAPASTA